MSAERDEQAEILSDLERGLKSAGLRDSTARAIIEDTASPGFVFAALDDVIHRALMRRLEICARREHHG